MAGAKCALMLYNIQRKGGEGCSDIARGGGGKQKKWMDEREESLITVPQFLNKYREKTLHPLESFQSPEKEGRRGKKKRQNKKTKMKAK